MNLVGNAIKFTPEDKAVRLRVIRERKFILFLVEDEGIGIPLDRQKRIFDVFEQSDSSTIRRYGGTGLGLAIVKQVTELLSGSIDVKSREGKGSIFIVKVPLIEANLDHTKEAEMEWSDFHFFKDNRILLVEDNLLNQEMIRALFKYLDLEIEVADNGKSGVEKAIELKPDLVLMDLHMPAMDGTGATRQVRMHPDGKDVPIVALSAEAFSEQQKETHVFGISDYLIKPLNIEKLIPVLKKYLSREQVSITRSSPTKPELPYDLKEQMIQEFKTLSGIPFYLTGRISNQVQKMIELCKGYDTHYPKIIRHEDAAFGRNEKKVKVLIEEVLK